MEGYSDRHHTMPHIYQSARVAMLYFRKTDVNARQFHHNYVKALFAWTW